ncbi:MAG: hypothetical protein V7K92_25960, partial [Nostoc sp.]|uniref:hypothetical protein n=1 Tax=Nostoc sp. TaxID=1180 RepID=UPI002FF0881F
CRSCSIRFAPIVFIPSTLVILHLLGNETALLWEKGRRGDALAQRASRASQPATGIASFFGYTS